MVASGIVLSRGEGRKCVPYANCRFNVRMLLVDCLPSRLLRQAVNRPEAHNEIDTMDARDGTVGDQLKRARWMGNGSAVTSCHFSRIIRFCEKCRSPR